MQLLRYYSQLFINCQAKIQKREKLSYMTLYFIRHGESESNRKQYFAGQIDAPLTELGHEQARLVATFFRDIPLNAVYASDLSRATETARPTADQHGLPVIPEPGLREVNTGDLEGVPFTQLSAKYPEQYAVWNTDIGNVSFPNGETMVEAALRAQEAVCRIAEAHPHGTVAVASHGAVIRAMFALWEHGSVRAMQHTAWAPNASVSEVAYENGTFRVIRSGMAEHLGELVTEFPKTI